MGSIVEDVTEAFARLAELGDDERMDVINEIRKALREHSPMRREPVDCVLWVRSEQVQGNSYNPNVVAPPEMRLLQLSIMQDGYTQPIVAWPVDEGYDGFSLPCGDNITVDQLPKGSPLWNYAQFHRQTSSPIPLVSLTAREASGGLSNEMGNSASRSARASSTMENPSASGSERSGESGKSGSTSVPTVSPTSGKSTASMTSSSYWELCCPICESRDPNRLLRWTGWGPEQGVSHVGLGMDWKLLTCESITQSRPVMKSAGISAGQETRSGTSGGNSPSLRRLVVAPSFEVVDGFHRTRVGKEVGAVTKRVKGRLPVSVINTERTAQEDRVAATIRHNRARGVHQVDAMSDIVLDLARRNWPDEKIGKELGMEPDEVLRLKQITAMAELFADREFSEAWEADLE